MPLPMVSLLLAAVTAPPAGDMPVTDTPIVAVVVFPDRASVTRRARVTCGARVVVPFTALPPSADAASFRAQGRGAAVVEGLRFVERPRATAYAARVAGLEARRAALGLQ